MDNAAKLLLDGFTDPIALPVTSEQRERWQASNREWWERQPMRYDWSMGVGYPPMSHSFHAEIDRRLFSMAREYMPWKKIPFDALIDFDALGTKDVLEIGVGNGSHAELLARHARSFTGIDITEYAVHSTSARLRHEVLGGTVLQMDAEEMSFPEASFDLVWSWGVIHHSADTARILKEIARVLRPGGRAVAMVYHRSLWGYHMMGGLIRARQRWPSTHEAIQHSTDGAIARYYTEAEWRDLAAPYLQLDAVRIYGAKAELLPLPSGMVKDALRFLLPSPVARFFTNTLGWGSFLVSEMSKR